MFENVEPKIHYLEPKILHPILNMPHPKPNYRNLSLVVYYKVDLVQQIVCPLISEKSMTLLSYIYKEGREGGWVPIFGAN